MARMLGALTVEARAAEHTGDAAWRMWATMGTWMIVSRVPEASRWCKGGGAQKWRSQCGRDGVADGYEENGGSGRCLRGRC